MTHLERKAAKMLGWKEDRERPGILVQRQPEGYSLSMVASDFGSAPLIRCAMQDAILAKGLAMVMWPDGRWSPWITPAPTEKTFLLEAYIAVCGGGG